MKTFQQFLSEKDGVVPNMANGISPTRLMAIGAAKPAKPTKHVHQGLVNPASKVIKA